MALIVRYGTYRRFSGRYREPGDSGDFETRLNLIALDYGYKYRLDIRPKNGPSRVEFVRTLREARFIGDLYAGLKALFTSSGFAITECWRRTSGDGMRRGMSEWS